MTINVRRATEADTLEVFKLVVAMHRETDFSAFRFNPEKCVVYLSVWIHQALLLLAVRSDGDGEEIIGMMAASKRNSWVSDDVWVAEDFLYVRPDARGGRAAFLLMRGFLAWADEIGARHIRAGVATGCGPAAERIYQHFGMRHVGGNYSLHIERSDGQ